MVQDFAESATKSPPELKNPSSIAELNSLIALAKAHGHGVTVLGGGTHAESGWPLPKTCQQISLCQLNRVEDYPARDMTITVQAGMTFTTLQDTLAKENQWLPLDVAQPEQSTLGGIIAANISGARRFGYGTLRDFIIGIQFCSDDGLSIHAGGRVVKNVAGYDLMKLHTGAFGTLGIISQVTLKVKPKPETSRLVAFGVGSAAVAPTLDRIHASQTRPVAVELINASTGVAISTATGVTLPNQDSWLILVGYEDKAVTVAWQCQRLQEELAEAPLRDWQNIPAEKSNNIWQALAQHTWNSARPGITIKITTTPSQVAALANRVAATRSDAQVLAHAENGIIWLNWPEMPELPEAKQMTTELVSDLAKVQSHLMVVQAPEHYRTQLPVWGQPRADQFLLQQIKATLDPENVFHPGKLFSMPND